MRSGLFDGNAALQYAFELGRLLERRRGTRDRAAETAEPLGKRFRIARLDPGEDGRITRPDHAADASDKIGRDAKLFLPPRLVQGSASKTRMAREPFSRDRATGSSFKIDTVRARGVFMGKMEPSTSYVACRRSSKFFTISCRFWSSLR